MIQKMWLRASGVFTRLERTERRWKLALGALFLCLLAAIYAFWPPPTACQVWRGQNSVEGMPLFDNKCEDWWQRLCRIEFDFEQLHYKCRYRRWMGGRYVCFDENLFPKDKPCIVYSFGINYDFDFDDAMAEFGCQVFSFDPSMSMKKHKRSERVQFLPIGLGAKDSDGFNPHIDKYVSTNTTWTIRRLASIMEELGHKQGSLTLLKIDIETYEWDVMLDILAVEGLLESIPQFLIEWHLFSGRPPRHRYSEFISTINRVKAAGFKKFHWNSEGRCHEIEILCSQAETSWVNKRFLAEH